MKNHAGNICFGLLISLFAPLMSDGRAESADGKTWRTSRTEYGRPDLQGIWDFGTITPLQRDTKLGERRAFTEQEARETEERARAINERALRAVDLRTGGPPVVKVVGNEADAISFERRHDLTRVDGECRSSIIVDPPNGRLPVNRTFLDYYDEIATRGLKPTDGPDTMDGGTRCLDVLPVPSLFPSPANAFLQIVQTQGFVVLFTEMSPLARIVRMGGRHVDPRIRYWGGDSIGSWEGETLIVHTTQFRPEQPYAMILRMSEEFELTERYTRVGQDEIHYRFTVVDSKAFFAPFTSERILKRAARRDRIFESACHEGNYSMTGILAGARKEDRDAAVRAE